MTQKTLDRELNAILQNATSELERGLDTNPNAGNISLLLDGVVEKLQVLKRKSEESISEELSAGYVCKRRLEHLKQNVKPSNFGQPRDVEDPEESQISIAAENQWKKVRLNRLIVEHFLRLGYYDTAEILANRSGIREISNLDIFQVVLISNSSIEFHL